MIAQDQLQLIEILEKHVRCHIPVRLVIGVGLVSEGGLGGVKGDRHALGFQPLAVVQQCLEKSIGHAGWATVLGGQPSLTSLAEGVEAPEGQGMAIHKQQQGFLLDVRHG